VGIGAIDAETPQKAITTSTIYALVIDSRAGEMKLYVNGKVVAFQKYSSSGICCSGGPLTIGAVPFNRNVKTSFVGMMTSGGDGTNQDWAAWFNLRLRTLAP